MSPGRSQSDRLWWQEQLPIIATSAGKTVAHERFGGLGILMQMGVTVIGQGAE